MSESNKLIGSGDGTRPTTDGGVDNIGAGEKFTTTRTAAGGEVSGPAPDEGVAGKRRDVEGTRHDDSAAFELHEDLRTESNKEPVLTPKDAPVNAEKD